MIKDVIKEVGALAGKFIKDADQQAAFEHELNTLAHKERQSQVEVNKVEAAHASVWVSGWRPYVGWICGTCLAWIVIGRDLMIAFTDMQASALPTGNTDIVLWVLGIILGANIGGRTFEKVKQVARERL